MNQSFRSKVVAAHAPAFELHIRIAEAFESAIKISRAHPTVVHVVLDMFMTQSMKAHLAVSLLAQHGMIEDAATIARRLMELGVQAVYIGANSDERERRRLAGKYLAFMWRQLSRQNKHKFPLHIRNQWSKIARQYGRFVPQKAKTWGPNWRDMFKKIGHERTYLEDYSLLSSIAHGRPEGQIFTYSYNTIQIYSYSHASTLLTYSSRYYLTVAEQWNQLFGLVPKERFEKLTEEVMAK